MSRAKATYSDRGKAVELPKWWLVELKRLCEDHTDVQLAKMLTSALRPERPISHGTVGDFLKGKQTTDRLMNGFMSIFPELPPPVFLARTLEEAKALRHLLASKSPSPAGKRADDPASVTSTIESTDEESQRTPRPAPRKISKRVSG